MGIPTSRLRLINHQLHAAKWGKCGMGWYDIGYGLVRYWMGWDGMGWDGMGQDDGVWYWMGLYYILEHDYKSIEVVFNPPTTPSPTVFQPPPPNDIQTLCDDPTT